MRIITKILEKLIPHVYIFFINDVNVKGPKTKYGDAQTFPDIRRFVLKHIQNLDTVLADLERERVNTTLSGAKSQFCMAEIKVIGYIYDFDGRYPDTIKVAKILEWDPPHNIISARAFIGVCVYFRI